MSILSNSGITINVIIFYKAALGNVLKLIYGGDAISNHANVHRI